MLTEDTEVDILFWHQEGKPPDWIARRVGAPVNAVRTTIKHGVVRQLRAKRSRKPIPECEDETPTPAEIRAACEDIQATWSRAERERRRVPRYLPYEIPEVSTEFLAETIESRIL